MDEVVSLHEEASCGVQVGSIGCVTGFSRVDTRERIRCNFGCSMDINMHLTQVVKKGQLTLAPFRTGDAVVTNFPDTYQVTLLNGQTLGHGSHGWVVGKCDHDARRIMCVFPAMGNMQINVLPEELMLRMEFMAKVRRAIDASKHVYKAQREAQKEVVSAAKVEQQDATTEHHGDVADAFCCRFCFALLLRPCTLQCGHTSCEGCLKSWRKTCTTPFRSPCCNTVVADDFLVNKGMEKDIARLYAAQLAIRQQEDEEDSGEDQAMHRNNEVPQLAASGNELQ